MTMFPRSSASRPVRTKGTSATSRPKPVARKSHSTRRPSAQSPVLHTPSNPYKRDDRNRSKKRKIDNDVLVVKPNQSSFPQEPRSSILFTNINSSSSSTPVSETEIPSSSLNPTNLRASSCVQSPKPDRLWVRRLVSVRRRARKDGPLDSWNRDCPPGTDKAWLRTQFEALQAGTLSMTLKCVLAAADISKVFSTNSTEFQKPEYRTRYWLWCKRFIKLVDFVIDNRPADPNVCHKMPGVSDEIADFVQTVRNQRADGLLPAPREELLASLGVRWSIPSTQARSRLTSNAGPKQKRGGQSDGSRKQNKIEKGELRGEKRKRSNDGQENQDVGEENGEQEWRAMKKWGAEFTKLRSYFQPLAVESGRYDVPIEAADVRIWQNAETARVSTGGSTEYCFGVLKCAHVINEEMDHSFKPSEDVLDWCSLYVQLVDAVVEKNVAGCHDVMAFLTRCVATERDNSLPLPLVGLLDGALINWRQMSFASSYPQPRRPTTAFGNNVNLASGSNSFHMNLQTKEGEMVSMMIKGLVAECVVGEKKTLEQEKAEEWVNKAGVDALNRFAYSWIRMIRSD